MSWTIRVLAVGLAVVAVVVGGVRLLADDPPVSRLGLHVTDVELAVWRERAAEGPYRVSGDVSVNSPGDWARVQDRAAAFAADPAASRWAGPSDPDGCVDGGGGTRYDPKDVNSRHLRDAAFSALVTGSRELRAKAATELVAQAQVANLDFSDRSRWCLEVIHDLNPGFEIANWLTSLLYALEYIEIGDRLEGTTSLTAAQKQTVLDWMYAAAEWMNHDSNVALAKNFTDRNTKNAPPYTLTSSRASKPEYTHAPYDGADTVIGAIAKFYNNRRAQQQRFIGLLGLHVLHRPDGYRPTPAPDGYTAETFVADSHKFVKDYLTYSVYPQGFTGEFQRWTEALPDLGWGYAMAAIAPVMTYVDAAARAGDHSLYDYTTSAGAHNTAGTPTGQTGKNYRWLITQLLGYQDGTHDRYIPGHAGDPAARIDGYDAANNWDAAHEAALAPVLHAYRDPYHQAVIDRTAPGTRAYPSKVAGFGQYLPWTGDWGTLPASLLMFSGVVLPTSVTEPVTEVEPAPVTNDGQEPKDAEDSTVCPADLPLSSFVDIATSAHGSTIDCVTWLGLATGATTTTFAPSQHVTRGQLATFLARTAEHAGLVLPATGTGFTDTAGSVHQANIERLAAAGIVDGLGDGRFGPELPVSRAQMASLLVRTLTAVTGTAPVGDADHFTDDDGLVHEAAIDAVATVGITTGTGAGVFRPGDTVRRGQMATFLVGLLETGCPAAGC